MIDFKEIKDTVPVPVAAEHYGLAVRNGMTCCTFHDDRNPSMKLYDDHFYCFGCTECGDVISLTARLFGLTQLEAAKKLCADFSISCNTDKPYIRQHIRIETQREKEQKAFHIRSYYYRLLKKYLEEYAPRNEAEQFRPLFKESLQNLELYGYYCDILSKAQQKNARTF